MRILFTGTCGTGKSSVFEKIFYIDRVEEVARQWFGLLHGENLMANYSRDFIQNLIEINQIKNWVENPHAVYDRGLVDEIAYRRFYGMEISESLKENCWKYRYDKVFIFPFWAEIYKNDDVRKESAEDALKIHDLILEAYQEYGYEIELVPKIPTEDRILLIKHITDGYGI